MDIETNLLIIGAGPFGLSMSAYCLQNNIPHKIVGKSMNFWKSNMPEGMNLRSGYDWHMDPAGIDTFEKFMDIKGSDIKDFQPIPRDLYIDYAEWFTKQKNIIPIDKIVEKLTFDEEAEKYTTVLNNGDQIISKWVLLALGFRYFKYVPGEFSEKIPGNKLTHTCEINKFDKFKDKKCLIIGGRMSAFESAALLNESGSSDVYISFRHDTPEFKESDWGWVTPLLGKMADNPDWYRGLDQSEKEKIGKRFFGEGRLKMEPWLKPRLDKKTIHKLPGTEIVECRNSDNGKLNIIFSNGNHITVDHVILATGYKVDIQKIPFLEKSNIPRMLQIKNGYPVLDNYLQTSVPGLYTTSMMATQDFGLFFGFTVSVNTSAKIIGKNLLKKIGGR